jgi:predicted nucleic acid-binding protein
MGLVADFGLGSIAIDTVVFIYFIEGNPRFLPLIAPLFREADQDKREPVTSALTLLEVLVVTYRAGNPLLAERYEALLTRSRGMEQPKKVRLLL